MYSNQVRQRIRGLVAGIGPSIAANPSQLEAKLADLAQANPEDVRLIVAAAQGGVAEEIAAAAPEHRADLVEQASAWMASEAGVSAEAARWAVETWAAALEGVRLTTAQPPAPSAAPPLNPVAAPAGTPNQAYPMASAASQVAPPAPWDTPRAPAPAAQAPWGAPPGQAPAPWGAVPPQGQPPAPWGPTPPQNQPVPGYGSPSAGAWPPPPGQHGGSPGQPGGYWTNTSGLQGAIPAEIAKLKWNWGAFCLPFWWLRSHNMRYYSIAWAAVSFIVYRFVPGGPIIRLGLLVAVCVALGLFGHRLAWQNRTFTDVDHYLTVQRAWMAWGIPIAIISWIAGVIIILGLVLMGGALAHPSP